MAGVRVVGTINFPSAEIAEQALGAMVEEFKPKQEEEGAIQYELFRSVINPEKVVLLEHWESRELYDKHWITQTAREGVPTLEQEGMSATLEFYDHQNYDIVDGIWEPMDKNLKIKTIRWA